MKKVILLLLFSTILLGFSNAQENDTEKKKFAVKKPNINIKKPNLRIGEKLGELAGNMMTGKTDNLAETAPIATLVTGMYDTGTKTSEVNIMGSSIKEGDHIAMITFMKQSGMGLLQINDGTVTCDGEPMEYMGMGSYMYRFDEKIIEPRVITIKTATQEAEFVIYPVPEIEIESVNGDATLPILDLAEDMTIKFSAEPSNKKNNIKVGLLTDVAGARAFNYFADFDLSEKREILIPKEALSNTEISGQLNAGQFNKGENYLLLERKLRLEKKDMDEFQKVDVFPNAVIQAVAYSTKPVIIKGRQEEGIIASLSFAGGHRKTLGYEVHKPNARTGIPFSRGSNFGLASLTLTGKTYKKETESGSNSETRGNTRYTTSWTRTTTYEFPQLPNEYWDTMLDDFYNKMTALFKGDLNIDFVPVETITSTADYTTLFVDNEVNTERKISRNYKNTLRTTPRRLMEIIDLSSSKSNDNPTSRMMNEAMIDGLVSVDITFEIGGDKDGKVVLIPSVRFSISGMDETKDNRPGTYAQGYISYRTGVPFNGELAKSDPTYLSNILNVDNIISCMSYMLTNLRVKEIEMGYDKIWSIGE